MLEKYAAAQEFEIESTRPAGFWIRVLAYIIDFLILMVFTVGAMFVKSVPLYLVIVVLTLLYKPVLEGYLGGTAGKLAIGLRVINDEGQVIGLVGGFVRSAIFILSTIPNILMQVKMIQLEISNFDIPAVQQFQKDNMTLQIASYVLLAVVAVACIMVAFTARKRGLHDMIADTYVIYLNKDN